MTLASVFPASAPGFRGSRRIDEAEIEQCVSVSLSALSAGFSVGNRRKFALASTFLF
jgi:hypothetical protein